MIPSGIKRWWRTKGHGIHSPFAYAFITDVLADKHPFYAYDDIFETLERLDLNRPGNLRLAKLLYRTVINLRPRNIRTVGDKARELAPIAGIAEEALAGQHTETPMFFVADNSGNPVFDGETARRAPTDGFFAVVDTSGNNRGSLDTVAAAMDNLGFGMMFLSSKGAAVAVALPHLPRQNFELRF